MSISSSCGILYVAIGEQYVNEAISSAQQLKSVMPDTSICLVTDADIDEPYIDHVKDPLTHSELTLGGGKDYHVKTHNLLQSPYEKTVFLDTDTYVYADFSEVFDLLDEFELAAAQKPDWQVRDFIKIDVPTSFPEYNTGVIAFRNTQTFEKFINDWVEYYIEGEPKGYPHDQVSFREAVYYSDIKFATLSSIYNCRCALPGQLVQVAKIFHTRFPDIECWSPEYVDRMESIADGINQSDLPRVFITDSNGTKITIPQTEFHLRKSKIHKKKAIYYRVKQSVSVNGWWYTVKRGLQELIPN